MGSTASRTLGIALGASYTYGLGTGGELPGLLDPREFSLEKVWHACAGAFSEALSQL